MAVVYLPVLKRHPSAPVQHLEREPQATGSRARAVRLAHDLKNCMSVMLFGVASLEASGSRAHKKLLEDAVAEMDRLVDDIVQIVAAKSRRASAKHHSPPSSKSAKRTPPGPASSTEQNH
jgi:hypothetical protein